jgi:hypothetical protein
MPAISTKCERERPALLAGFVPQGFGRTFGMEEFGVRNPEHLAAGKEAVGPQLVQGAAEIFLVAVYLMQVVGPLFQGELVNGQQTVKQFVRSIAAEEAFAVEQIDL